MAQSLIGICFLSPMCSPLPSLIIEGVFTKERNEDRHKGRGPKAHPPKKKGKT